MSGSFSAQVDRWVRKAKGRQTMVVRESAQRLFSIAQTPGPSVANPGGGEGGKMPVDEAFLRNTGAANIGAMPSGPSRPGEGAGGDWDETALTFQLAGYSPGDVLFWGWTAAYARKMEERYGFMKGAASEWQGIVNQAVREAKARIR